MKSDKRTFSTWRHAITCILNLPAKEKCNESGGFDSQRINGDFKSKEHKNAKDGHCP